jgi:hypothetical protein
MPWFLSYFIVYIPFHIEIFKLSHEFLNQLHVFWYLESGLLFLFIKGMRLEIDNIYSLIIITTIKILANVECGVFKLSKVNQLTILLSSNSNFEWIFERKKDQNWSQHGFYFGPCFLMNYESKKKKTNFWFDKILDFILVLAIYIWMQVGLTAFMWTWIGLTNSMWTWVALVKM